MSFLTKHLKSVDESYFEHGFFALKFGVKMVLGGFSAILHGIFPFLFEKTASRCVIDLFETLENCKRMSEERKKKHGLN